MDIDSKNYHIVYSNSIYLQRLVHIYRHTVHHIYYEVDTSTADIFVLNIVYTLGKLNHNQMAPTVVAK